MSSVNHPKAPTPEGSLPAASAGSVPAALEGHEVPGQSHGGSDREELIRLDHLGFAYPESSPVLKDISLSIYPGEKIVLLAPNGSGKSTLFYLIMAVLHPDHGERFFKGQPYSKKKAFLRDLRTTVSLVFQDPERQIFASTVEKEVSFGAFQLGYSEDLVRERTDHALDLLNLTHLRHRPIQYLSFGEKKRLSIADVLVMDSRLIMLDEPTAWLDAQNTDDLMEILARLNKENRTLLCSTHNVDFAYSFADRVIILHDGVILFDGPTDQAFDQQDILRRAKIKLPKYWIFENFLSKTSLLSPSIKEEETWRLRDAEDLADLLEYRDRPWISLEGKVLRRGYTTGSTFTAAACAAFRQALGLDSANIPAASLGDIPAGASAESPAATPGETPAAKPAASSAETILLPQEGTLTIPVDPHPPFDPAESPEPGPLGPPAYTARAQKDGGDDVDVTDQTWIYADLWPLTPEEEAQLAQAADAKKKGAQDLLPAQAKTKGSKAAEGEGQVDKAGAILPASWFPAGKYSLLPDSSPVSIYLFGGPGVGHVTLPGLKVAPGEAAINPGPRMMVEENLEAIWASASPTANTPRAWALVARIPGGENLAKKTFNPRLGIVGGISLIGTTGVVEPLSEKAYKDSLAVEIRQQLALDPSTIILASGNASGALAKSLHPGLGSVEFGNLLGYSLRLALDGGADHIILSGPLGKLIKVSGGIFQTHSHLADARQEMMMARALEVGMSATDVLALRDCPTTEAGLALIQKAHLEEAFLTRCTDLIAERIHKEFWEYLDGESSKGSPKERPNESPKERLNERLNERSNEISKGSSKKTLEVVISDLSGHLLRRATFAFPGGGQIMAENRVEN